jgi:FkbM family methyltransferase
MPIKKDFAGILPGSINYIDHINSKNPTIIQIGSHDGIIGEEYGLQEFLEKIKNFKLILVEPLNPYFDNLKKVYGKYKNQIIYCNYAISDVDGQVTMTKKDACSFINNLGDIKVNSKSWSSFINDVCVDQIDLLLLDCEGYEYNIIKQINFEKIKPKVIRYEYAHIENKNECDNFLKLKGYKINFCFHDHTFNKVAIL